MKGNKISGTELEAFDIFTVVIETGDGISGKKIYRLDWEEPPSLEGIEQMAGHDARIIWVIAENPLRGNIYRYGNHGDFWECVLATQGYA